MAQYGFIDLSILRPDVVRNIETRRTSIPTQEVRNSINITDYFGVRSSLRVFKHKTNIVDHNTEHLTPILGVRATGYKRSRR